jgi:hypothetical protein
LAHRYKKINPLKLILSAVITTNKTPFSKNLLKKNICEVKSEHREDIDFGEMFIRLFSNRKISIEGNAGISLKIQMRAK